MLLDLFFPDSVPAEGTYLIHHKRRGQPGSVMRGGHMGGLIQ